MKIFNTLLVLLAVVSLSACQPDAEKARAVETLIETRLAETQITGLAVGVVHQGHILVSRGFGYGDAELAVPVSPELRFQIGSTSKLFTALAVMQLVENGQIQLDDDVRTYLPNFTPKALSSDALPVTVRDLLTHHSGIPSAYLRSFVLDEADPTLFMQTSDWLSDTYLTWPHQQVFAYCNVCFSLMGEMVARVSQQSYDDYIRQHIFEPLSLNHSLTSGVPGVTANTSIGFTAGEPTAPLLVKDVPAGSFLMSANDMAKFAQALVHTQHGRAPKHWIKPDTLNAMLQPQYPGLPMNADFEIGLGFWLDEQNGLKQVGHGGTVPPFYSELKVLPETGSAVFIAANDNLGNNAVLDQLAAEIFDVLVPDTTENNPVVNHSSNIASGDYNLGGFGLVSILDTDNTRFIDLPDIGQFALEQTDDGWYAADLDMRLRPADHGIAFHGYLNGYLLGPAFPVETAVKSGQYAQWLGQYESNDLADSADFYYDDARQLYRLDIGLGVLGDGLAVTLKPISDSLLQVQGYGRNVGNVIQLDVENGAPVLRYSGITFRNKMPTIMP